MTLVHNEFESRPERILITYDDVIKTAHPFLLNKINEKFLPFYEDFLDTSKFKGLDIKNLQRMCMQRTDKNLFRYLSKIDFDVDESYRELKNRYFEVYEESPLLEIGESLILMLTQKFTEKVYIYSDVYDLRIHLDIQNTFRDMERVIYVSGDFGEVLDRVGEITSYFLSDLDYLDTVIEKGKAEYSNIMLANYAYNYILDEDTGELDFRLDVEKMIDGVICKFATFTPVALTEEHFSQIDLDKV